MSVCKTETTRTDLISFTISSNVTNSHPSGKVKISINYFLDRMGLTIWQIRLSCLLFHVLQENTDEQVIDKYTTTVT